MARACCGFTRAGRPCSLTSASTLVDDRGRSVASPLRRGGDRCLFHARPFCSQPISELSGPLVILIFDLETSGTDVSSDRIVELSAVQALPTTSGACFSTVVRVDADVLSTPAAQKASEIHTISTDEILASPCFPECWQRFLVFVEALLNEALHDYGDSSDDEPPPLPRPPDEPPTLLLAAHNGFAFDFGLLLCECYRHDLDLAVFERWLYVDTLSVFKANACAATGCMKLQCMVKRLCSPSGLQAHRGRDDCVALLSVLQTTATQLGCTMSNLLRMFAETISLKDSFAQISVLVCKK
eukprot:1467873-Karenia_brevis.AAC.2